MWLFCGEVGLFGGNTELFFGLIHLFTLAYMHAHECIYTHTYTYTYKDKDTEKDPDPDPDPDKYTETGTEWSAQMEVTA